MTNPVGNNQQLEILESLRNIELALSRLYFACSQRFPEDRELWAEMNREEQKHAVMVDELKEMAKAHPDKCSMGKFNLPTIATFLEGIEKELGELNAGKIDGKKALILSRDLENSLLEKNFIDSIVSTLPEFQKIKRAINQETYQHRKIISDRLELLNKT